MTLPGSGGHFDDGDEPGPGPSMTLSMSGIAQENATVNWTEVPGAAEYVIELGGTEVGRV